MKINGEIHLAESWANKQGIPTAEDIKVRVGAKIVAAKLIINKGLTKKYWLSPSLISSLVMGNTKRLQIRYDQNNEMIHIGPIVGILTSHLPNHDEYDPKSLQAELIYLSKIGFNLPAQYYIFTPESINWTTMTVRGYNYRCMGEDKGVWLSSLYPMPDVVYDRIATRRGELQSRIKTTKKRLKNLPYLKYFNPAFLNKWRVHKLLTANEDLKPYIPETKILNAHNLIDMISRHKTLYLKPCNGSLGKGIIKVNSSPQEILKYTIYNGIRRTGRVNTPSDLLKRTSLCRGSKAYIVQQGLDLATYHRSPFDIRIIYQKNKHGEWQIAKKFVRVAPYGSSIANLSSGGTVETSKKIMAMVMGGDDQMIDTKNDELKTLCEKVAQTLETVNPKTYGELGLDIGVDIDGKLWLIEVNSKPRKTTESIMSPGIVRNSFRRPLQYAIHLAGFKA